MLFTILHYEPDIFEDEIREIVYAIKENKPYDNCPELSSHQLLETLHSMKDDLDLATIQEKALRNTVRNILLKN
tara:strand:- start:301 stop:522 length:222 start_codon:yes stop_codon:yes gene_type:complete